MTESSDDFWKLECEKRIKQLEALAKSGPTNDKRQSPRFRFEESTFVQISGPPSRYRITDISPGGVSFRAFHAVEPQTQLMLSVKDSIFVEVEVIGCDIEESDADLMEYAYKVRSRFVNEQDGYMAFVMYYGDAE